MKRMQAWRRVLVLALVTSLAGSVMGLGCMDVATTTVSNFNPCGTILNCDPAEWDLLMNPDFPDWDLDPTCTIPGQCGGVWPYNTTPITETTDADTTTTN